MPGVPDPLPRRTPDFDGMERTPDVLAGLHEVGCSSSVLWN